MTCDSLPLSLSRYSSCQDFLSELALLTSLEGRVHARSGKREDGTVNLSSVHQAKGSGMVSGFYHLVGRGAVPLATEPFGIRRGGGGRGA